MSAKNHCLIEINNPTPFHLGGEVRFLLEGHGANPKTMAGVYNR